MVNSRLYFAKNFIFDRKYIVPKFATDAKRGNVSTNFTELTMKITTKILLFLFFLGLSGNAQEKETFDKMLILGKWTIYATTEIKIGKESESLTSLCNSCPEVTFSSDRFAKIKFPNGEVETYVWRIENGKFMFMVAGKIDNPKFESEYLIKLIQKNKFLEMELTEENKNYSYTLRK